MLIERRYATGVELRAEPTEEAGAPHIRGTVAVYNRWSPVYKVWGEGFRERIAPSFFTKVLEADVRGLFNHDPNFVLGRTPKTLRIWSDDEGLHMDATPPETGVVRDLVVAPMQRGDVTGASFSFALDYDSDEPADLWEVGEDGVLQRTLLRASALYDVGPVTFPFYEQPALEAKSAAGAQSSYERWQAQRAATAEHEARAAEALLANGAEIERRLSAIRLASQGPY
jgi:HK97 family phage prohead protease